MYYVCMTDKFMSGWENKVNKLVIECDTLDEAEIVERNAKRRGEMRYVNIRFTRPYYNSSYKVSRHDKTDYAGWFTDRPEWR